MNVIPSVIGFNRNLLIGLGLYSGALASVISAARITQKVVLLYRHTGWKDIAIVRIRIRLVKAREVLLLDRVYAMLFIIPNYFY